MSKRQSKKSTTLHEDSVFSTSRTSPSKHRIAAIYKADKSISKLKPNAFVPKFKTKASMLDMIVVPARVARGSLHEPSENAVPIEEESIQPLEQQVDDTN